MKKIVLLFLLFNFTCYAQGNYSLLKTIETECDFFTTDNQCNVYSVKKDELTKYNKAGKLLYKYSNKNLGNITSVDASNMLRILLYYKDFLQVVFLDNTLSQNGDPVSLDKIGFQQVQLVCSSNNNSMWVYDQQNFALVRLDKNMENIQQTSNLNALLNDSLQPNCLVEYDNKVYLNNPQSGIMIFDIYGTYYKTIPVKNALVFQPIGDWVYYMFDKKVKAYNTKTTEEKEFVMPADFTRFRLEMDVLLLQDEKFISLYSAQ
ncbi:MAG TPA: hypothetical protein VGC65_10120 [Bacteroidia bacterium]|jgi:hypothetical protein